VDTDLIDVRHALVDPSERLHASWLEARDEWGRGAHQAGTGLWLAGDLDVDTRAGFAVWLGRLRGQSDTSLPPEAGMVHATYWWIVQGETYLGAIILRHALNDILREVGGHRLRRPAVRPAAGSGAVVARGRPPAGSLAGARPGARQLRRRQLRIRTDHRGQRRCAGGRPPARGRSQAPLLDRPHLHSGRGSKCMSAVGSGAPPLGRTHGRTPSRGSRRTGPAPSRESGSR
jgi:hypothetical protein